jgi:hypothetical protein
MRNYLGQLPRLKKIALGRDSYEPFLNGVPIEHYYEDREAFNVQQADLDETPTDPGDHEEHWELAHRKRIRVEGDKYARVMPELEWLYFGQLPMTVTEAHGSRKIEFLSTERDDCYTLLRRIFVWEKI